MNRTVGAWLLAIGIALAILGGVLWAQENSRVHKANETAAMGQYLFGNVADAQPNHTSSIVLWVVGGSAGLFGMLLIANAKEPPSEDEGSIRSPY